MNLKNMYPEAISMEQQLANAEEELRLHEAQTDKGKSWKERHEYLLFSIKMLKSELSMEKPHEYGINIEKRVKERLNPPTDIEKLTDKEVEMHLYQLIDFLAQHHLTLEDTNHLSDRELYRKIMNEIIQVPIGISGQGIGELEHVEVCPYDDFEMRLRFYMDDDERASFPEQFGDDIPIPAKEAVKSQRDDWIGDLARKYVKNPIPE